ncbi:MAG: PaaI family thioesterase [Pseudomonadota bacterium]|nr:PaaI family thioesterase [Pseudomonadota bacterium]
MTEITPPLDGYTIYDPIDPLENHVGPFFWKELEDGIQHFILKSEARHCNRHEILHGGLMMTMIDLAMVVAAKETWDEQLVTVSLNSEFVDAGRAGDLIEANGELVRRTGSMAFVRGRVYVGERTLLSSSAVLKRMRVKTTER